MPGNPQPEPAPLESHAGVVQADWIDYNGHMNLAYYVLAFDYATDAFLEYLGLTGEFREKEKASTFSAEIHVNYIRELREGDGLRISTQLLDFDEKRLHYFHRMFHASEGYLAATSELLSLYVDMNLRRVAGMPGEIRRRLDQLFEIHRQLPDPEQRGRVIGIPAGRRAAP